jgi:predicted phosphodiesterase
VRIAALSDVHGNLRALTAVFADMDRRGAFDFVIATGDHVLKGPFPRETLELLRDRCDLLLLGNTDAYLTGEIDLKARLRPHHWKLDLVAWTKDRLGAEGIRQLKGLPFEADCTPRQGHRVQFVHANPKDLEQSLHPEAPEAVLEGLCRGVTAEILVFGHIHIPYVRRLKKLTLCNVASAGIPKDGDVRPAWTALTYTSENRWTVEQRRVTYDAKAAARDHTQSGMPAGEKLAERLLVARYK